MIIRNVSRGYIDPFSGSKRAIGRKNNLVNRKKLQAAFGGRCRSKHCGICVEVLLEIIERTLLQALAKCDVVFVTGARAQHVPARAECGPPAVGTMPPKWWVMILRLG